MDSSNNEGLRVPGRIIGIDKIVRSLWLLNESDQIEIQSYGIDDHLNSFSFRDDNLRAKQGGADPFDQAAILQGDDLLFIGDVI
ncbi:hypothetical protein D3C81_1620780 [compost metagenome]